MRKLSRKETSAINRKAHEISLVIYGKIAADLILRLSEYDADADIETILESLADRVMDEYFN